MASKRKSTTPCMVRATELIDQEDQDIDVVRDAVSPSMGTKDNWEKERCNKDTEMVEEKPPPENQSKKLQGGYECKYCPYVTQYLNEFTEHVDLQHPNVILNPLYVCAECNFTTKKYDSLSDHNSKYHPGESNFKLKLMKRNNQTILEQSIEGSADVSSTQEHFDNDENSSGISVSKMPIMKPGKARGDMKKGRKLEETLHENQFEGVVSNGILNDIHHHDVLTHVMPSVQLPPNVNLLPKIPVPLNSTKYNSALDTNTTLINSFNKFPYPTQAELSWLTAASKHPEEQIRIWFATQRLKHGISWSPEEVEEARKKMFNGTIQSVPQTITVLPGPLTTTAKVSQPIIQTALPCQILGQTGLVLTQVTNTPAVTVPQFSANTNISSQSHKRLAQTTQETPEPKRQNTTQSPLTPKSSVLPVANNERKKTKEQIAVLKASFVISQFPDDTEIYRLIDATGLSRSEIKKWFSDHRYRSQRGIVHITSESIARERVSVARSGRPYHSYRELAPRKLTETTDEQLRCLENSFLKSSYPTQTEIDHLKAETKLSRKEIDLWFSERRKIRDSMEQAVLDSMGSGKTNEVGLVNGTSKQSCKLSGAWPQPAVQYKSKQEQLHLLKSTFARTQWPSPQEYDQLAAQTGLVRTEIVKWFKDNRCVLRTGSLRWMEQYRKHYERSLEERRKFIKMVAATTVGKDILTRYFQEYGQLHEEDLDLLVLKSKMDFDQVRVYLQELQQQAILDQLESSSLGDHGVVDSESTDKDWVKISHGDEGAISDGADSWGHATNETPEETQDYDFGSVPSENAHK
ncbi:zinc fingers and homeoboxes protein 2 [Spea bombifrons]|uniref:zinc fingers and homeoboxes protein 2 n=1 Tax=Spea bombifrons TaxID=233779 RepID=UPI00234B1C19|nr:zinc fingers and homeoboxes protein 2 [Spea bombifrons]